MERPGGAFLIFSKLMYQYLRRNYNCDIPRMVNMDGVYVCHNGFGIVINPDAKIGKGTVIQHSVTIGINDPKKGAPTVGENVFIGCRACVLGDIKIGNNVKIGAGAVVLKDVPDNCTVVGVPAHIVSKTDCK
jgi:serine O-acetyltransferase